MNRRNFLKGFFSSGSAMLLSPTALLQQVIQTLKPVSPLESMAFDLVQNIEAGLHPNIAFPLKESGMVFTLPENPTTLPLPAIDDECIFEFGFHGYWPMTVNGETFQIPEQLQQLHAALSKQEEKS